MTKCYAIALEIGQNCLINMHQKSVPQMLNCDIKIHIHIDALITQTIVEILFLNILLYQTRIFFVPKQNNSRQKIGN